MLVPEDMLNLQAWYEHRFAKRGKSTALFCERSSLDNG